MADLIYRDELIKEIRSTPNFGKEWDKALCEAIVKDAPTVDAMPVVHGHWVSVDEDKRGFADEFECSACNRDITVDYYYKYCDYDFCPHCGARMDEKDGEKKV